MNTKNNKFEKASSTIDSITKKFLNKTINITTVSLLISLSIVTSDIILFSSENPVEITSNKNIQNTELIAADNFNKTTDYAQVKLAGAYTSNAPTFFRVAGQFKTGDLVQTIINENIYSGIVPNNTRNGIILTMNSESSPRHNICVTSSMNYYIGTPL